MGPAAFIQSPRQPLFKFLLKFYRILKKTMELLRVYKITFDNRIGLKIAEMACRKAKVSTPYSCKILMTILDSNQINCVINRFSAFVSSFLILTNVDDVFLKIILDKHTKHFYEYAGWNISSSAHPLRSIDSIRLVST